MKTENSPSLLNTPSQSSVSLLDPDMPLDMWIDQSMPVLSESTNWKDELFDGITTRDAPRVIQALSHLPVLPSPENPNDKLSFMSVRYFHPEIVTALRQAKLSYGAVEISYAIYAQDNPEAFAWFVENMSPVAAALGFPGQKKQEDHLTDVSFTSLLSTKERFEDLKDQWRNMHACIAYSLLSEWMALEVDGNLPKSPILQDLRTFVFPKNLNRWLAESLKAISKSPADALAHERLVAFLDLPEAKMNAKLVFGQGSCLYDRMEPENVYNLQTYLMEHPALNAWVSANAREAANTCMLLKINALGPYLTHQLGWASSRFGKKISTGMNSQSILYGDVQSNPNESSFLDCLLLCATSDVADKFIRLSGAEAAIRRRLSDDRAGFIMAMWVQRHAATLGKIDLFKDWTDNRGNTVAHYLFALRASQGNFSKSSSVSMAREFSSLLLVENSVNNTPLAMIPSEFAAIVERTLLRKTVRSVQKEKVGNDTSHRPTKRIM